MSESRSWIGPLVIAGLVAAVLGEFLVGGGTRLPSHELGDTVNYFVAARGFAAEQLLEGKVPLWNPYTFSGTPFVGVFQSSVFYPLMWLHLVLEPARAFSWEFALNVLLLGLFAFWWLRGWGLHWIACCFGALVVTFGGTSVERVLAGQLTVLGTFAWVPLVLLAVDRLAERPRLEWVLAGVAGTSLMVLAGHPPTLFMAGVTIGFYCVPAVVRSGGRVRLLGALACIPIGAFLVSAVQLWTGLQVLGQAARTEALSYEAATSFSMPPENLLTLVAPGFFGESALGSCYGRWWCWDVSAFVGCGALVLAIHGALAARGRLRARCLTLVIVLTVLALGGYTPVYRLFFALAPGFDSFRSPSKFMFFACLFGAGLAAVGADRLLRADATRDRTGVRVAAAVAGLMLALGAWQWLGAGGWLPVETPARWVASLETHRVFSSEQVDSWDALAGPALLQAGALLTVATAVLWLSPQRRAGLLLVGLGSIELLVFAQANHGSIPLTDPLAKRPWLRRAYARSGEDRVLELLATNAAVAARGYNVWGYDPMFLGRYAEFIAYTQGRDVATLLDNNRGHHPNRLHRLLPMLRVAYLGDKPIPGVDPLPRALLVGDHRVEASPEAVIAAMDEADFDPRRTAILEREPVPPPTPAGARGGKVRVTDESSDRVRLEVEIDAPALLVVTDAYADGWRASALPGSSQRHYEVLRANAVLRAVPLQAGVHRIRLEYAPIGFRAGVWASGLSSSLLVGLTAFWLWRRRLGRRSGR